MKKPYIFTALLILAAFAAACGSVAEPAPNSATLEAEAAAENNDGPEPVEVVVEPSATPAPPTSTPVPPTATPEPPTATPLPPAETEAPAEDELSDEFRDIVLRVSRFGRPENGAALFAETLQTSSGPFACTTCHMVDNEIAGVGPGMYNLRNRAGDRIDGIPAEVYVVNSIMNPNAFIVEGFVMNVMPGNYSEILSEQEIFDLAAYLLSLGDS